MTNSCPNIRPNFVGDRPVMDPSSFVDPSAQIIGNVQIGKDVYVGPTTVIRADEPDDDGKVQPVVIEAETNIQDGVIIHSRCGTSVVTGSKVSITHGVIIHGPCEIGEECFLSQRSLLYRAIPEEAVWVGIGSIIMRSTIPSGTMVPVGSLIRYNTNIRHFRCVSDKEENYQKDVLEAGRQVRKGYMDYYET